MPRILLFAACAAGLLAQSSQAQTVQSVVTTADLLRPMEAGPSLAFRREQPAAGEAAPVIEVDDAQRFQTMEGFGASVTDGSAYLLQQALAPADRDRVMREMFDPRTGMGLSFLRQPIGSEDLSRRHFTFDTVPPGQTDPTLAHFAVPEEQAEIFKTVKEALTLNPRITVMVTPWSPPAWMKSGGTMNGGELIEADEAVYAHYLTRAVQSFQAAGIRVKYITVQNEPLNGVPRLASTYMPAEQASRLIGQDLGPDLRRAGLRTAVLAYDHNWNHPEYPEAVLANRAAAPFIAGSALHCYGGRPDEQDGIHAAFPDKGIWMTECSGGTWDKEPPLIKTAHLLISSTRHWAKAVSLWGVALDQDHGPHDGGCDTCRPLVTVDTTEKPARATYTGDLYGLGHASRFVHPGAVRVGSSSFGEGGIETTAFRDVDGTIVLLALNRAGAPARFEVRWHGRMFFAVLPASALATYTWKAGA